MQHTDMTHLRSPIVAEPGVKIVQPQPGDKYCTEIAGKCQGHTNTLNGAAVRVRRLMGYEQYPTLVRDDQPDQYGRTTWSVVL